MLRVVVATLMSVFLYDAFLYAFARVRYDMRRKCLDVITVGVATLLLLLLLLEIEVFWNPWVPEYITMFYMISHTRNFHETTTHGKQIFT